MGIDETDRLRLRQWRIVGRLARQRGAYPGVRMR
jgi:hypothetical protein